uniref:Uncharacterized protein n=1 Tax=Anguilla anguilla TaxID=7936 RepID=A0A0E9X110_ANGAN
MKMLYCFYEGLFMKMFLKFYTAVSRRHKQYMCALNERVLRRVASAKRDKQASELMEDP